MSYSQTYRIDNLNKVKNIQRRFYLKNCEAIKAKSKKYYNDHIRKKRILPDDNIYELTPKRIHDIKRVIKELDCKETKDKLYDMMDRLQNKPDNQTN